MMGGGDEARIDCKPTFLDGEVVVSGGEIDATQLLHLHAATGGAEIQRQPFEGDNAVAKTVKMSVPLVGIAGHVVDQKHVVSRPEKNCFSARTWRR